MKSLYDEYATLREQAPIHIVSAPGGTRYCIYRYEDVAAAFKDQRFVGGQTPPHVLRLLRWIGLSALANAAEHGFFLSLQPPDHTRIRKVMEPAFAPRSVKAMEGRIEHLVALLLDRLDGQDEFDFVADFAAPLPARVIAEVFGFPPAEMDAVRRWTDDLLPMVDAETRKNSLFRGLISFFKFRRRVLTLVAERMSNPNGDLLSALAEAHHGSGIITRDELVGSAALVLTAGHVTTRHLLTNCVRLLIQNPGVLEEARQNPDAFDTVVEEVIRFVSPVQISARVMADDVECAGHKIPSEAKIRLFIGAANHDPRRFENPDVFDTDRATERHLGFGGGVHFCLGIHLARLEVKIALKEVFRRFPNLTAVENGTDWGPSRKFLGVSRFRVRPNPIRGSPSV